MMRSTLAITALFALALPARGQEAPRPIIDIHLHAYPALQPTAEDSIWIPLEIPLPATDTLLMDQTIAKMEQHNIVLGVLSGSRELVAAWVDRAPDRFIRGVQVSDVSDTPGVETVRGWIESGDVEAFGEFSVQYADIRLDDDRVMPYVALLEELDVPLFVHLGPGPRHGTIREGSRYTIDAGDPLALERVLAAHPNLRVAILHAGWPMGDDVIALLHSYPQVYVGVGVINWYIARPEFHRYLQRIVDAGFGDRVLFGSDQMHWPEAIDLAIESIEEASYLSEAQKADIFYHNAARFLKLGH
ncbi:MAG: amidohydrolase [Gemmatimonadetes bacterium]|nr:amidohydrolase [Gemmatimonadota bacterium]